MWQVSFCYICCRCCRITFANKPGRQKKLWLSNVGSTTEEEGAGGWPTFVGDFYAEFYYTFTGSFK